MNYQLYVHNGLWFGLPYRRKPLTTPIAACGKTIALNPNLVIQWIEIGWMGRGEGTHHGIKSRQFYFMKLEMVKKISTPRKTNAILLNMKINWPKLANRCRYKLAKVNILSLRENIAKSFKGDLHWLTLHMHPQLAVTLSSGKYYTNIDWYQGQHWKILPRSCVMLPEGIIIIYRPFQFQMQIALH